VAYLDVGARAHEDVVRLDVAMNEAQPQGEVERSRARHDLEDVAQLEQAVAALYFCSVPPPTTS